MKTYAENKSLSITKLRAALKKRNSITNDAFTPSINSRLREARMRGSFSQIGCFVTEKLKNN